MDCVFCFLVKVSLWVLGIVAILMFYFLESLPSPRRFRMIQKIPGPKGVFYLGNALELKDTPVEDFLIWLSAKMKCYKRLMRMWFLGVSHVYVKEPEDVQVVLNSKQHITKGAEYFLIMPWLDEGLLTSTGDKWTMRRKMLTPTFHFKILEDNMTTFNKNSKIFTTKLKDTKGQEVHLESLVSLCTLDVIMSSAMGMDFGAQTNKCQEYVSQIKRISEILTYRSLRPHLYKDWIFHILPIGRLFWKSINFLHNFSYNVINERKVILKETKIEDKEVISPEGVKIRRAFLDTLLEIEMNRPGTLSDKDIREEVDTFMFEGHDTTSAALVFIFFNLARYPEIQESVYNELYEIFGDSDRDTTVSDLHEMNYLEKVIKESLRLYPSVPYISRYIDKDLVLEDGFAIAAPSNVVVPIYQLHRNEKHWPDPEKFDPERFADDEIQGRHPYAYIPFSAGPRNCIGQKFAMMELKTVVSTVIRTLRVEPVTKREDFKLMVHLVIRSNNKIYFKFVPR